MGTNHSGGHCWRHFNQNDNGLMEKKISPKFFLLSSVNILAILIMTWGDWMDSLALFGALVVLVLNHATLVKMVNELTLSMTSEGADAKRAMKKGLFFMVFKMILLFALVIAVYFYNKDLTAKVMLLMIFQLIIQVVSIKNNY